MVKDRVERLSFTFFDTQALAGGLAVVATYQLFQVGRGQAGNGFLNKSEAHTNMPANGSMPSGHKFFVDAVSANVVNTVVAGPAVPTTNDVLEVFQYTDFSFMLANKEKLSGPLEMVGGGNHVSDFAAAAALPSNGWPMVGNVYPLGKRAIVLDPNVNFRVTIAWRFAPPVALSAAGLWIRFYLHGRLFRYAQ
jgi:hypothetical protein